MEPFSLNTTDQYEDDELFFNKFYHLHTMREPIDGLLEVLPSEFFEYPIIFGGLH